MSPFDKARYERLLEGLEVTIVPFKVAIATDPTGRIDSSFFEKQVISARDLTATWDRLGMHAKAIVCGPFGSNLINDNYVEHGIPMIRPFNLRNCRSDIGDVAFLSEDFVRQSGLKTFPPGTIMFARVGDVGAGINLHSCATISPNIIAAELRDSVNPHFLGIFANTRFGVAQLQAGMKAVAQPTISTDSIRNFRIPSLSFNFQIKIAEIFKISVAAKDEADRLLEIAEATLIAGLGLDAWKPPEPLSYVRSSSHVITAERLDAEHFQPRFAALAAIMAAKGNCERLGDQLLFNARGRQPEYADTGLPVINSKHVLRNEVRYDDGNRRAIYDADTSLIQFGDVLINGTGVGTIGRSAAYIHGAVALPDNHVTILRPTPALDPIYLAVFLNSLAGQLQVNQRLRGSSGQIELYPADIAEFRVWVSPKALQQDIRRLVEQSYAHRQRATRRLDAAKRAVEIAIEDSEAVALAHLAAANPPEAAT